LPRDEQAALLNLVFPSDGRLQPEDQPAHGLGASRGNALLLQFQDEFFE
jgi:hypothetical protein